MRLSTPGTAWYRGRVPWLRNTPSSTTAKRGWLRLRAMPASRWALRIAASATRMDDTVRPRPTRLVTYIATVSGLSSSGSGPRLRHQASLPWQAER